jgi:hypothetical protein
LHTAHVCELQCKSKKISLLRVRVRDTKEVQTPPLHHTQRVRFLLFLSGDDESCVLLFANRETEICIFCGVLILF